MTSNSLSKEDVLIRAEQLDFPSSVVEFFQGYLGQPVGGFPEPLRTHIIRNKPRINGRPGATMDPLDFKKIKAELRSKFGKHITDADVTSYVMYPKVCHHLSRSINSQLNCAALRSLKNTKVSLRSMVT
jgi:pyruvate carboxylase